MEFLTSHCSYTIEVAKTEDLPGVLKVMRENFYYEETMFEALSSNISEEEKTIIERNFDGTVKAAFETSFCLVAVEKKSKEIVGVNLTSISNNPKFGKGSDGLSTIFSSDEVKSKVVDEYFEYLAEINEKAELFKKYPDVEKMLEFYAIAVDKNHRRKNLAADLLKAGIFEASKQNIGLVFGVFTSQFSTKSAEKAGMKCDAQFDLLDYKKNGKLIFENTKPHNIVSVMILYLKK